MTLGADTFNLNKSEFGQKLGRIITNHRAGSKLIGEAREFVLRACRLTERWGKLSNEGETQVYLRYNEIAGGRKIKMIYLERGTTQQPVPKNQLLSALYPPKKTATTATPEQKHFNAVRVSMRFAITYQLRAFRDSCTLPTICSISGKKILPGARTDVDHCGLTFSEIADKFIEFQGLKYTDIILVGPPTAKTFKDKKLWEKWVHYHLEHARYSLVLSGANRSKGADGYTTKAELLGSFKSDDPDSLSLDF
jgi:hypothetical protein